MYEVQSGVSRSWCRDERKHRRDGRAYEDILLGEDQPLIENRQEAVHSGLFRVSNSDCTPL
jgi:hypothetical protein